jgi:hypothetical protein
MYANLLAGYQQAYGSNLNEQGASALRNKQAFDAEQFKQQQELKRKNKFWNRMGHALSSGVTHGVGMGVSGLVSSFINPFQAISQARGGQVPSTPDQQTPNAGGEVQPSQMGPSALDVQQGRVPAPENPWASYMAKTW